MSAVPNRYRKVRSPVPAQVAHVPSPQVSPANLLTHGPLESRVPLRSQSEPLAKQSIVHHTGDVIVVGIQLSSRFLVKRVPENIIVANLAEILVREHRLEIDADDENVIIWEYVNGIRRPLRNMELVASVVKAWPQNNSTSYFLHVTSAALRNDVDSLASLVPRRDMLRQPPEISHATIWFSLGKRPVDWTQGGLLSIKDNTLTCLSDEKGAIVAEFDINLCDPYEWPNHRGPAKYVVVIRSIASNLVLFVSTDSARTFSVLRNAVYTARTRTLGRGTGPALVTRV